MDLDLSADFELVTDNLRSGTLKVSGQSDVDLDDCVLEMPVATTDMDPTAGNLPQLDSMFIWSRDRTSKPPLGTVFVDTAGTYWTILAVREHEWVSTYECICRNLSIVTADANQATVLKATYGKGRSNEAKALWVGAWSGAATPTEEDTVPARFQPSREEAQIRFGADYTKTIYRVYFENPVPVELAGAEYRLVDADGYRYRILEYYDEERIDRLPVAIAIRILEGEEYWTEGPGSGT